VTHLPRTADIGIEGTISDTSRLNRLLGVAAVVLAAALVWIAASGLRWPARAAVVSLLTLLPVALAAQGRQLEALPAEVPRIAIYASSAAALWMLAGLVLLAAVTSGFSPAALGLRAIPPGPLLSWTVGVTAGGLLLLALSRALGVCESPMLLRLLPRSGAERLAFAALSATAGVTEELVFRGFLIPALETALGSAWFAAVLSSLVFGFLHGYQQTPGMLRAGILGFGLALPLIMTRSLLPAILAHTAYDIVAGVFLARLWLRTEEAGTWPRDAGIG
jgi:membrane protease YdiL (CAAX protease family)